MCGIVGLLAVDPEVRSGLGAMFVPMLQAMSPRGPDSTGVAWFDAGPGELRVSLLASDDGAPPEWAAIAAQVATRLGCPVTVDAFDACAVLTVGPRGSGTSVAEAAVIDAVTATAPGTLVAGIGMGMDVLKSVGDAATHEACFSLARRDGIAAVGHTRMATESAVEVRGCHPFAPGGGLAVVHNGSFSNYMTVRRDLAAEGVTCDSMNDSEVCARLIARSLRAGESLGRALEAVSASMDGFFTLLVATPDELGLAVDSYGCKPAVVAEHAAYVAIASEYHALATLPGVAAARRFEPGAGSVNVWELAR